MQPSFWRFCPSPPKMLGIVARDARQRQVNNEMLCELMEAIFAPMVALGNSGLEVECADRKVRLCFSRLMAWIADHLGNVTSHGIQQNQCAVCEVQPEELGSHLRRSAAKRDYRKYEDLFNKMSDNDQQAEKELTECGFKITSERLLRSSERSTIRLAQARYSPCFVPGNIRNTLYEMDNLISKGVQVATNIRCRLEEFSCLSRLFPAQQRAQSDRSVDQKRDEKSD